MRTWPPREGGHRFSIWTVGWTHPRLTWHLSVHEYRSRLMSQVHLLFPCVNRSFDGGLLQGKGVGHVELTFVELTFLDATDRGLPRNIPQGLVFPFARMLKRLLTMQSNPASQHKNEKQRQDCSQDDPDVVSAYGLRSSLRDGLSRNVVSQPEQPAVCACRSGQSRLPNQLNPNRVQESSRSQQECRRRCSVRGTPTYLTSSIPTTNTAT